MKVDVIKGIEARLEDPAYRQEYGAATVKYDLAHALSEGRRGKGLTQRQMAEITGVSQAYIARLESGEANPSVGQLGKLLASIWLRASFELRPLLGPEAASTIHLETNRSPAASTNQRLDIAGNAGRVTAVTEQSGIKRTNEGEALVLDTNLTNLVVHEATNSAHKKTQQRRVRRRAVGAKQQQQ
jgi:transcriptional regulator with XRE-family HTH domain